MLIEAWSGGALLGLCGVLALGCGSTTSGSGGEGGGGSGNGPGGGAAGAAGAAGSLDNPVTELPLEPGTCGVARTVTLPPSPFYPRAAVTRHGGGFAMGPWKVGELSSELGAYIVDEGGREPRFFEAHGSTNDVSWPVFLAGPGLAVEVFVGTRTGPGDDAFDSRAWEDGADAALGRGNVVNARWRGTDEILLVPTLSGERAIFAIWPHGLSEPRAAMIGADGARVGDSHTFVTPDEANRCAAVTPTEQGAFISFVDSGDVWRLLRLDENSQVQLDAQWLLPSRGWGCPTLTLADSGLAFLLERADVEEPSDVGLYRVDVRGAVSELALPSPTTATQVAMDRDEPLLLEGKTLSRPLRGESFPVVLPPGLQRRVPSEPGNILLDIDASDEGRTLVELTCR